MTKKMLYEKGKNWKIIHKDFGKYSYLRNQWEEREFTYDEVKKWISIGLTPRECVFATYLRQSNYQNFTTAGLKKERKEFNFWIKDAQNWLSLHYSNKQEIRKINCHDPIWGSLIISGYLQLEEINISNQKKLTQFQTISCPNLKKFDCYHNNLTTLDLTTCLNLRCIDCSGNYLTNLDLTSCFNLQKINCRNNRLKEIKLPITSRENLKSLNLGGNNFPEQDLSFLSSLISLEKLEIDDNHFTGSLESLKNFSKLEVVDISNTNVDSGLEYLPNSLKEFRCLVDKRENAKCQAIYNFFIDNQWEVKKNGKVKNFSREFKEYKREVEQWKELYFSDEEIKLWARVDLKFNEYEFANYLRQNGYRPDIPNIQEVVKKESWRDICPDFDYFLRKEWENQGLTYEETKELVKVGLRANESNKIKDWRDKNFNVQRIKEWMSFGLKISDYEVIKEWKNEFTFQQVKEWIRAGAKVEDYKFIVWLRDVKKETSQWVASYQEDYELLSERFKRYGLCSECDRPNSGEEWCKDCNSEHLKKNFKNWTSGKAEIDQFIQKYQLESTEANKFIEWIPYEQFTNIEYLAKGGFGKVYKAKWTKGNVCYWNARKNQWQREKNFYYGKEQIKWWINNKKTRELIRNNGKVKKYENYREVALKSLNNSFANTEFLNEIAKHKIIDDWFDSIVSCYGISQEPETGNYLMVMEYVEGGNLREFLNSKRLGFKDKLKRLVNIAQGLKDIHAKGLIHRDFHSGNILENNTKCLITDLGLCRPVSETNEEDNNDIYGVLPYIAPEVLRNKNYTQASDIYSFGIIAHEILVNSSPYLDREYDYFLALDVCNGLRPSLNNVQIPQLLKDLIKQCWDAEPLNRPTASQLEKTLRGWQKEAENKDYRNRTEFYSQYRTIKENDWEDMLYKTHSTEPLTSRKLKFRNLPKPQNSKVTSEQFYSKETENFDSLRISTSKFNVKEILIENKLENLDLTNIHPSFNDELIKQWQNLNFTYQQVRDWINVDFKPTDYNFCAYLRDTKHLTPEKVLNHGNLEQLNQEFFTWWKGQQLQFHQETPPKN